MLITILYKLIEPYLPAVTKKVIDQLLRDNDRLNDNWRQKYFELEQEKWYWYDKYMDTVYEPDKKDV